jgi:glucan-binding YG repeat protein
MVKDGHWRANGQDPEKAAWEESVRLREQMFWSRIGGGVIPAGHVAIPFEAEKSPRTSHDLSVSAVAEEAVVDQPDAPTEAVESNIPEKTEAEPTPTPAAEAQTQAAAPETKSARNSTQSLDAKSTSGLETPKRLSITIPTTSE